MSVVCPLLNLPGSNRYTKPRAIQKTWFISVGHKAKGIGRNTMAIFAGRRGKARGETVGRQG